MQRETDRQIDTERQVWYGGGGERKRDRQTGGGGERKRDRQTDRQMDRQMETQGERKKETKTARNTETENDGQRGSEESQRDWEREMGRQRLRDTYVFNRDVITLFNHHQFWFGFLASLLWGGWNWWAGRWHLWGHSKGLSSTATSSGWSTPFLLHFWGDRNQTVKINEEDTSTYWTLHRAGVFTVNEVRKMLSSPQSFPCDHTSYFSKQCNINKVAKVVHWGRSDSHCNQ